MRVIFLVVMISSMLMNLACEGQRTSQGVPSTQEKQSPRIDADRAAAGSALFNKLKAKIPGSTHARRPGASGNPELNGPISECPTLTLYVTNKIWSGLTHREQVDLTWYVESMIPIARSRPAPYVFEWMTEDAPIYPRFVQTVRELCDDCWSIILGDPKRAGKGVTMTVDRTVVQGDTPWERSGPTSDRGIKASVFRRLSAESKRQ